MRISDWSSDVCSSDLRTREDARKVKDKATTMASEYATAGKDKASNALESLARLMRDAATTVDERLGENYGKYARKTADAIENAAGSLRERDFSDMADDTREFVLKSPVMAVGAAAAFGFVLARLLRSGSSANADRR